MKQLGCEARLSERQSIDSFANSIALDAFNHRVHRGEGKRGTWNDYNGDLCDEKISFHIQPLVSNLQPLVAGTQRREKERNKALGHTVHLVPYSSLAFSVTSVVKKRTLFKLALSQSMLSISGKLLWFARAQAIDRRFESATGRLPIFFSCRSF